MSFPLCMLGEQSCLRCNTSLCRVDYACLGLIPYDESRFVSKIPLLKVFTKVVNVQDLTSLTCITSGVPPSLSWSAMIKVKNCSKQCFTQLLCPAGSPCAVPLWKHRKDSTACMLDLWGQLGSRKFIAPCHAPAASVAFSVVITLSNREHRDALWKHIFEVL